MESTLEPRTNFTMGRGGQTESVSLLRPSLESTDFMLK